MIVDIDFEDVNKVFAVCKKADNLCDIEIREFLVYRKRSNWFGDFARLKYKCGDRYKSTRLRSFAKHYTEETRDGRCHDITMYSQWEIKLDRRWNKWLLFESEEDAKEYCKYIINSAIDELNKVKEQFL